MRRRFATGLVLATLAGIAARHPHASAQQFVLSSQDRARLIAVDFVALGANGHPVTDLRADEVTLKIDGRARPIRTLEYVQAGDTSLAESAAGPLPVPYGSNALTSAGRSIVLIVDEETIRAGKEAALKAALHGFLSALDRRDRVALVTVPYGGLEIDLTDEHTRLAPAVNRLTGHAPRSESASDARCRTRTTLTSIVGTLDSLRGGEAPVAVVFISGHLAVPQGIVLINKDAVSGLGECEMTSEDFQRVGAAAARTRAQFYVVHPDLESRSNGLAGLEHLAGVTGGPLLHLSDVANAPLTRVARETAGYYLARIEPDPSHAQGSVHGFSIEVSRPGLVLRRRPQMAVARQEARFVNAAPIAPLDMMREARMFRDLPLRVTGQALREAGGGVRIVTLFDAPGAAVLSAAMIGLFDATGRLVARANLTGAELAATPAGAALSVPPGSYRLRVAATESLGRAGTADFAVEAELVPAGPLKLSGLMLGLSRRGAFVPRLEFGSEPVAVAWVEIYGGEVGTPVDVAFELSDTMNGPARLTMPGIIESTNEPDRFVVSAALPIESLPPGDYLVRAIVAAAGQPAGRVIRTLRKRQ